MPIRDDLKLERGPLNPSGSPSWIIHDPVANRFFRIGWLEFETLNRWGLGDSEKIVSSILKSTTMTTDVAAVDRFVQFLLVNDLLVQSSAQSSAYYVKKKQSAKKNILFRILTQYLYFRIPLVQPDSFLKATLPFVRFIFSPWFFKAVLITSILGGYLIIGEWSHFIHGFNFIATPHGKIFFILALIFSKCCHEMGHGYAAVKYGCRVPTMGIGMMIFWPILWTDTTHAWKVRDRNQRLIISASGIYVEIIIAAMSTLIWAFLPDGPFRSSIQMLAASTWILTVVVNLNPLMKFDGYFLISDLLDIPNLQSRSFAIARWWLHGLLYGLQIQPPEVLPRDKIKVMIIYSVSVWIYRFFLYLSIALTIYLFFFKALGLLLMMVQFAMYLIPLVAEMNFFLKNRGNIRWYPNFILTCLVLFGLGAVFFFPWKNTITVPAILKAEREAVIYNPSAAQIFSLNIMNKQPVKKGDLMVLFRSPEIEHHIDKTRQKIRQITIEMERNQSHEKLIGQNTVKLEEYHSLMADLNAYLEEQKELSLRAPFDGIITDMPDHIKQGDWIPEKEMICLITQRKNSSIIAFVPEINLNYVHEGQTAHFYPDGFFRHFVTGTIHSIDLSATKKLIYPEISSIFGGALPVQRDSQGYLLPVKSVYRLNIVPNGYTLKTSIWGSADQVDFSDKIMPGQVKIFTQSSSLARRFWIHAMGVFIRESGL